MINFILSSDILNEILSKNKDIKFIKLPYKRYADVIAYEHGLSRGLVDILNKVEGCSVYNNDNIESKFTKTPIGLDKISDGSKTLMYIYFRTVRPNSKEIINVTSCGSNAIEYILRNYSDSHLTLYMGHLEFPSNIQCRFRVNGTVLNNTDELFN